MSRIFQPFQMQPNLDYGVVAERAIKHGWTIPDDIQGMFGLTIENAQFWVATYWPHSGVLRITFYDGIKEGQQNEVADHIIEVLEGHWKDSP